MSAYRIIQAYSQIDDHLRTVLGIDRGQWGFRCVVDEVAKRISAVRRYVNDLKQFADLRNAIVHDKQHPERVIAEPHLGVVAQLEHLVARS